MLGESAHGGGGGATSDPAGGAQSATAMRVAELAGECASPPSVTYTAIINIKCPDQTGVVRNKDRLGCTISLARKFLFYKQRLSARLLLNVHPLTFRSNRIDLDLLA